MGNNGNPHLNNSGCYDPTAFSALSRIDAEERADKTADILIRTIRNIIFLSGFELTERIQIKHKKTGKTYK